MTDGASWREHTCSNAELAHQIAEADAVEAAELSCAVREQQVQEKVLIQAARGLEHVHTELGQLVQSAQQRQDQLLAAQRTRSETVRMWCTV